MHIEEYIDFRKMLRELSRECGRVYGKPKHDTPVRHLHLSRSEGFTRRMYRRARAQLHIRSPTKNTSHLMMVCWLQTETLLEWSVMGNPSAQGEKNRRPF